MGRGGESGGEPVSGSHITDTKTKLEKHKGRHSDLTDTYIKQQTD